MLIADLDGIYDPSQHNDRLLLGLKGNMSEAELRYPVRRQVERGTLLPSAHSYFDGTRFANLRGLRSYRARLAAGKLPTASSERIDASRARADAAMLGLRLVEGIHAPTFDARFGGSLLGDHRETIERLAGHGLVEVADDHLRLTRRGYLLANQVWMEFV